MNVLYLDYSLRDVDGTKKIVKNSQHNEIRDIFIHTQLEGNRNHVNNDENIDCGIEPKIGSNIIHATSYRMVRKRNDFCRVDFFQTFDPFFL